MSARTTYTVCDGGLLKRRVMRRVGKRINELEALGWKAGDVKVHGIARIAVSCLMTADSTATQAAKKP